MTASIRKRVNKKGVKWQVVLEKGIDCDGKRRREAYTFDTKAEAEEKKIELLHECNIGTHIEPSKMTVKELCAEWYACHVTELAPTTRHGYRVNLEKHIYPNIGNIKLQKLTPMQIKACYDKLKKKGLSPRSIHYVHTTLHSALEYARKLQLIPRNITEFVTLPKETKYEPTIYTDEEIQKLISICKGTEHEIPVNLAIGLGLRRGEALALKWEDIDFATNTVSISRNVSQIDGKLVHGAPKTAKSKRTIVVPEALIAMLRSHRSSQAETRLKSSGRYHNNDLVCCDSKGDYLKPGSYSARFSSFLKKNGMRHIRFHDLRHMNATMMLKAGVPMKVASERLGHSDINITMNTYSHVTADMNQMAAEQLNNTLYKDRKKA